MRPMPRILTALILGATMTSVAQASTAHVAGGYLEGRLHWTKKGSPYIVDGWIYLDQTATLTIDPGVTVQFSAGAGLTIIGTLTAVGTAASQITFTSSSATPTPGIWGFLFFDFATASGSHPAYATITYGVAGGGVEESP